MRSPQPHPGSPPPTSPRDHRRSGVALLLVISTVAIMSLLVIAFLSLVRTEEQSSEAFAQGVEVRNLADVPLNLVIGQLRKATENNGNDRTWASQPGMIRVFGKSNDSGQFRYRAAPDAAYKLYSSDQLVWNQGGASLADHLAADAADLFQWQHMPGVYTDLNDPVPVLLDGDSAKLEFPIVDPRARASASGGGTSTTVAGFDFPANQQLGSRHPQSRTDDSARLPMPVKWIYVLHDGSHVTPTGGDDERATFSGPGAPTRDNPIVGRVAFWTDDESAKVNINTASEGVHWEIPKSTNVKDYEYADRIPVQNEYSRYPGHPAMTSLSPVIQSFGSDWIIDSTLSDSQLRDRLQRYYALTPHIRWGGTEGGTIRPPGGALPIKQQRLYSSVDELFFDPDRDDRAPAMDPVHLGVSRFFLTTHSRAPELNLFGKPRISLWPVTGGIAHGDPGNAARNQKDALLAFLGTGGGREWFFQRAQNYTSHSSPGSSQSTTEDFSGGTWAASRNRDMINQYLRPLTGYPGQAIGGGQLNHTIPGFGAHFFGKYEQAGGNPQAESGVGGTETGRWERVLASSMDLVRWGVNQYSTGLSPQYAYLPARGGISGTSNPGLLGETGAVPLIVAGARGFGRWPTITETAIVFFATEVERDGEGNIVQHDASAFPARTTKMRAFIVLEPFSPTQGPPSWSANVRYRLRGLNNLRINGETVFRNESQIRVNYATGWVGGGHSTPYTGLNAAFRQSYGATGRGHHDIHNVIIDGEEMSSNGTPRETPESLSSPIDEDRDYAFISIEVDVPMPDGGFIPASPPTFQFSGGQIQIDILPGWDTTSEVIQTITKRFPAATLRVPRVHRDDTRFNLDGQPLRYSNLFKRTFCGGGDQRNRLIRRGDITRSVHARADGPTGGDLRFHSPIRNVTHRWFHPHPAYTDTNVERLHFLRNGGHGWGHGYGPRDDASSPHIGEYHGNANTRMGAGSLLPGWAYWQTRTPNVPRGLMGALNRQGRIGDFDNGIGIIEDGPYIRMPDQGNYRTGTGVYMGRGSFQTEDGTSFSPNRQIASAVAFGSLPTGIPSRFGTDSETFDLHCEPWQTLLFSPNPPSRATPANQEPNATDHRGFGHPRDHLYLDLFWMPIVEPYAISEPFSTAGKINMNYQIMPFTYIERSTGIHAALKATRLSAIHRSGVGRPGTHLTTDNNSGGNNNYKEDGGGTRYQYELRYDVNIDKTLDGFRQRFDQGDIFRSATEICEIFLVPERIPGASYPPDAPDPANFSYAQMNTWWNGSSATTVEAFEPTGDNTREEPYNQLYPRLTTKSNTYTVHYRVQRLRKARGTNPAEWVEGSDRVAADSRGSATIERYLDPNDTELRWVMVGTNAFANSWDDFYRLRIINRRQFTP